MNHKFSKNPLVSWIRKFLDYVAQNKKEFIFIVAIVVGISFIFTGYFIYKKHINKKAYQEFIENLKYYDSKIVSDGDDSAFDLNKKEFKSEDEKWQKVAQVFKDSYLELSDSSLASVFLIFQSEALIDQGKLNEAIEVLKKAIKDIPNKDIKNYYQTKLALMQIDTGDEQEIEKALGSLQTFASDKINVANDFALYCLGNYYFQNKKFDQAQNYWNQLYLQYGKSAEKSSQFAKLAKEKLKLMKC